MAAGRIIKPVGPRVGDPCYKAYGWSTAILRCVQTLRKAVSVKIVTFDHSFVQSSLNPTDTPKNITKLACKISVQTPKLRITEIRSVVSGMTCACTLV